MLYPFVIGRSWRKHFSKNGPAIADDEYGCDHLNQTINCTCTRLKDWPKSRVFRGRGVTFIGLFTCMTT